MVRCNTNQIFHYTLSVLFRSVLRVVGQITEVLRLNNTCHESCNTSYFERNNRSRMRLDKKLTLISVQKYHYRLELFNIMTQLQYFKQKLCEGRLPTPLTA